MAARDCEKVEGLDWMKFLLGKLSSKPVEMGRKMKELEQEDPRRAVHSFKVALALTAVSLFYYFRPLYDCFGDDSMWAILTVVVVFEYSVGATLGKGLNRMMATVLAGAMGLGAHRIAHLSGKTAEPLLLGFFVFVAAGIVTFLRFFPGMKARYDYGLVVFNLTFCLVSVSGYRETEVVKIALQRVSTIVLGSLTAMVVCFCICPVWSGDELHNSVSSNLEKLGGFLEGFVAEYLEKPEVGKRKKDDETSLGAYRTILTSKNNEETMANLARWEPGHGKFKFRHPWKQYLKIGTLTRDCAYRVESLSIFLDFENRIPPGILLRMQEPITRISSESGKALKELGSAIRDMTRPSLAEHRTSSLKAACDDLRSLLESAPLPEDLDLLKISPVAATASVLTDIVTCIEKLSVAVDELATLANFRGVSEPDAVKAASSQRQQALLHRGTVQPFSADDEHHHVITIEEDQSPAKSTSVASG